MSHVYVVGSLNWDATLSVQRLPGPGETVLGEWGAQGPGGKGSNQVVAAARAGAATTMVGAIGDDENGRRILSALNEGGVRPALDTGTGAATGSAVVMVDSRGENSIVVAPGANAAFLPDWARTALEGMVAGDVVVAQGEIPPAVIEACAEVCREWDGVFVLNLAPVIDVDVKQLAPDYLVVNEHEARELAGAQGMAARGAGTEDVAVWAAQMQAAGVTVVETRGAAGSRIHTNPMTVVPATTATTVVDTTGAGDAFVGAFAAGLAAGLDVADAAAWGAAGGALAVAAEGAQGADFTRDDVVRLSGVQAPE